MRTFQEGAAMQVAMVVRDMEAAMKRHWDDFKIGPWDIYHLRPLQGSRTTSTAASRRPIPA